MPRVYGAMGPMDEEGSTEATPPSTPTTQSSSAGCTEYEIAVKLFDRAFKEKAFKKVSMPKTSCTEGSNGDVKLTSEAEGKPALKVEMLTDRSKIWWDGYSQGYAWGEIEARNGEPFSTTKMGTSQLSAGFDYGHAQGYQMYKALHPGPGK
jgi:hypothetical protein